MTTNFPSSADAFTNPTSGDTLDNPPHDQQHADINDAMEAVQTSLLDGAPLHIDDANERVGIGDTTPSYTLDVNGDINATGDVRVAGNPVGMVLVKSHTIGNGVSSVTVTDAFSSTFENYRMLVNVDNSVTAGVLMTLNNHGSGGYYYSKTETSWAGVIQCFGGVAQNDFAIGSTRSGNGTCISVELMNPNRAEITAYSAESVYFLTSGYSERIQGWHNSLSQATSVTVFPSSGTMTGGTIRVYGYNNG